MSEVTSGLLELLSELLTLAGALFFLISAIGLLRLPDFFCRVHAPTKAGTLGILLLGLGAVLQSLANGDFLWLEELAILVFLFLTIPVSSQVLARAARRRGVIQTPRTTAGNSTASSSQPR
jgi:multicomponent K+:H+ antiporter subunit G